MGSGENTEAWPMRVNIPLLDNTKTKAVIEIRPGITTLVGPNGSGKTRALRTIKDALKSASTVGIYGRKIHFLAAGRSSPLEHYRASIGSPHGRSDSDAAVGHISYRSQWWDFESVTGILLALDTRADLRLKVEARLQQLFDRSVQLSWSQDGLNVRISPMAGGRAYAANHEASGILQLVALLAAIHNDEIGALLIDEPEISLHPQHQAFLLEEMEKVAGDPSDPVKKLVVIATHSTSLLPLRRIGELPSIVFFNSASQSPAQVSEDASILKRAKLTAVMARLSTTHRMAMFAERVLLVEGPSDEIVVTQLARRLDMRLLARNAQIVPITGKGEFGEAVKLFRLMNKEVAVLADLDALTDDNSLVCLFSELPNAVALADRLGRKNLSDLDRDLRDALAEFMSEHQSAVDAAAESYPDWSSKQASALTKRRVTLARVLIDPASFGNAAADEAGRLRTKYDALLKALGELGCFFLQRGAIENYYHTDSTDRSKPDRAAEEAAGFDGRDPDSLTRHYADVITALAHIAPNQRVDEDLLLRPKLGAVLTAAFLSMNRGSSDEQLNSIASTTIGADAEVFRLSNCSNEEMRLRVDIASPLFKRDTFPFELGRDDNTNVIVPGKLPGIDR
ncbi:ATP-dependent endonuclease [Rhodoplanes elegans]|uniref:ATP-dependent endonuclease n=2 Tax=Rhodoplanes elegans TaxID=29408 RepID=A0A327K4M3_9BRAD|nr:ATP-dependent endonuclease [Rhodoplanes elegans]RAI32806.1 ATP-dependent endonuclease [Rhodoplanes elegans]